MSDSKKKKSNKKGKPGALWDGVEVPAGVERERMEHIDAALQKVRRYDRGEMKLPSAKQFAQELGVKSAETIQRLIRKMKDLHGIPIDWEPSRKGYYYTEDVVFLP